MTVAICRVEAAEIDEMQSFVGKKADPRWLWHAIDHDSGDVLAYTSNHLGSRAFTLTSGAHTRVISDKWGAYTRHLDPETHQIGKILTQKIERKHLTLRTRIKRLARKSICFSKSILMHDTVIGLFINRYEFGMQI